jgi:hypothetical protein
VYFFVTIDVGFGRGVYGLGVYGLGVYGRGFQVLVGIGLGDELLPLRLAVMINFPVFGSV